MSKIQLGVIFGSRSCEREVAIISAVQLMNEGTVARVVGWEKGEGECDWTPALFESVQEMDGFVYGDYAGANLSKYCVKMNKAEGKTLVVLKPCDTLSFRQLIHEHRLNRDNFYLIGAGCKGMKDESGLLLKCKTCKGKDFEIFDEIIDDEESKQPTAIMDRMEGVTALENETAQERFDFWRNELSRCIRCNACRNVCPACTCEKCVFDNPASSVASKAPVTDLRRTYSTLSAPSTWPAAVRTAANAAGFAPSTFRCTF